MSFTEAKYYIQVQAKRHERMMLEPSEGFEVCDQFLQGMEKEEFYQAYRILHGILKEYYTGAKLHPVEMGLPAYDMEQYRNMSNEARESEMALLWLPSVLYALGCAGRVEEDRLSVDLFSFKQELKNHRQKHLELQIVFLQERGFLFPEWNKGRFPAKLERFTVEYPDHPKVLLVLLAAARKVSAIEHNPAELQRFDLYRISQFPHLHPSLFKDAGNTIEPYDEQYFIDVLECVQEKEFFVEMMRFFHELGMSVAFDGTLQKNRMFDAKGKDTLNYWAYTDYRYGKEAEGALLLRLKLNNPEQYKEEIERLPEEIRTTFETVGCGHCSADCSKRIIYSLGQTKKEACGYFSFLFRAMEAQYAGCYQQLHLLEQDARKSKKGLPL